MMLMAVAMCMIVIVVVRMGVIAHIGCTGGSGGRGQSACDSVAFV